MTDAVEYDKKTMDKPEFDIILGIEQQGKAMEIKLFQLIYAS